MNELHPKHAPGDMVRLMKWDASGTICDTQDIGMVITSRQRNGSALSSLGGMGATITRGMSFIYFVLLDRGIRGPFEAFELKTISPTLQAVAVISR